MSAAECNALAVPLLTATAAEASSYAVATEFSKYAARKNRHVIATLARIIAAVAAAPSASHIAQINRLNEMVDCLEWPPAQIQPLIGDVPIIICDLITKLILFVCCLAAV